MTNDLIKLIPTKKYKENIFFQQAIFKKRTSDNPHYELNWDKSAQSVCLLDKYKLTI